MRRPPIRSWATSSRRTSGLERFRFSCSDCRSGIFFSNWLSGAVVQSRGWRAAFYVACVPGLLCGLLTLFIKEPMRGQAEQKGSRGSAGRSAAASGLALSAHPGNADHSLDYCVRRSAQFQHVRAQRFRAGPGQALLRSDRSEGGPCRRRDSGRRRSDRTARRRLDRRSPAARSRRTAA